MEATTHPISYSVGHHPGHGTKKFLDRYAGVIFVAVATVVPHILFSWTTYTPTDEGFNLSYSRRILEGQIPHLDFIIIRPFISPLLHVPLVFLGGNYTYWISRLEMYFQFATMSWVWVLIFTHLRPVLSTREKLACALTTFVMCMHFWGPPSWHTTDALWLASLGFWLCLILNPNVRWIGYFVIGLAYLCKQSFLFAGVITCVVNGDYRRSSDWIAMLAPGFLYFAYLFLAGVDLRAALMQLASHTDFIGYAAITYVRLHFIVGLLLGIALLLTCDTKFSASSRWMSPAYFSVVLLPPAYGLLLREWQFLGFHTFGMAAGAAFYFFLRRDTGVSPYFRIAILSLVAAWSSAISIGYNSPVLGSGLTTLVLVAYGMEKFRPFAGRISGVFLSGLLAVLMFAFVWGRVGLYFTFHDTWPSHSLSSVLPGGSLLHGNPATYDVLADLNRAIQTISDEGKQYAIVSDFPGWWVQARQTNPLPLDWLIPIEASRPELVNRVLDAMQANRGRVIYLVPKYSALGLGYGSLNLNRPEPEAKFVMKHFRRLRQTRFFVLYG
ncbi:MAG TPA: hypothetical protein VK463_10080 [Desulfomonilaceae bacterium]|nr:hypothetical protein [Desulfomonilaceae bacterium]